MNIKVAAFTVSEKSSNICVYPGGTWACLDYTCVCGGGSCLCHCCSCVCHCCICVWFGDTCVCIGGTYVYEPMHEISNNVEF